jgi:hypothetical protein
MKQGSVEHNSSFAKSFRHWERLDGNSQGMKRTGAVVALAASISLLVSSLALDHDKPDSKKDNPPPLKKIESPEQIEGDC